MLSGDNKNKINVGAPAVSHLHKQHDMHYVHKNPNMPDYTFPLPCSKLVPSGYMVLAKKHSRSSSARNRDSVKHPHQNRSRSCSPMRRHYRNSYFDGSCERIRIARTGPLYRYAFAEYFHKSTSTRHANHLLNLLPQLLQWSGKSVVFIFSDGGPDWSGKALINLINYRRIWKRLGLDCFVVARYAPGHSKYNMIERRWSNLTKRLARVTFSARLEGEESTPWDQNFSAKDLALKLRLILDKAVRHCNSYFKPDTYGGYSTSVTNVLADSTDLDVFDEKCPDQLHQQLQSCRSISGMPDELFREARFVLQHYSRSVYAFQFAKCPSSDCCCHEIPIRAKEFMKFHSYIGGYIPTPSRNTTLRPGHYRSLLEDLHVPLRRGLNSDIASVRPYICDLCSYACLSTIDHNRHRILLHQ